MFEIDHKDRVARISIDRGSARNAIPIAAWDNLAGQLDRVTRSGARALILRSAMAGTFSAGADIAEMPALKDDAALRGRFRRAMGGAIEALAALPIATVALVEGDCFGAAVALTMACDVRIATPAARFAITPAKLGIGYPPSDIARLKGLVGRGQAARLLLSAATIDAREALSIGLIEQVADDAEGCAMDFASTAAANAPSSIAILKRSLAGEAGAAEAFESAFGGTDFAEGLAAFRERRPPKFDA